MTAEIAIFNRGGVALAADSAVTVIHEGTAHERVYRSANKLFALAPGLAVGIMVYGNAGIMGIPWETIITGYGRQLGDQRFGALADYAADLLTYTGTFLTHVEPGELERTVSAIVNAALDELFARAEAQADGEDEAHAAEVLRNMAAMSELELAESAAYGALPGPLADEVEEQRGVAVEVYLDERQMPAPVDAALVRRLHAFSRLALSRNVESLANPCASGVVVAGYGEQEIFPVVHAYEFNGLLGADGPCHVVDMASERDEETGEPAPFRSSVFAFAQNSVVRAMLEGMEPGVLELIRAQVLTGMLEMANATTGRVGKSNRRLAASLQTELEELAVQQTYGVVNTIAEACHCTFGDPVIQIVDALPRAELAATAEAFVKLQAFKRRLTMETESVAAPVDVLVISKAEGLVWVKRKG